MKKYTKLLGVVLIIALVMSMGTMALAAGTNTITVDKNFRGQEYRLYKIFNATTNTERQNATDANSESSVTTGGIAYTLIDETDHALTKEFTVTKADGTTATVKGADWFEFVNDSSKNIKAKDGADITTELFRLWAKEYGQPTGNPLTASADDDDTIKWENLDDGYYFISTTTGSLVTVDSVAPNAIVKDKNSVPTVDKTVQEDSIIAAGQDGDGINGYQKQNDQEIGKKVYYKTVIAAKKGGTGYVLMDKMSTGLTFDGIDSIEVYKGSVAAANKIATGNTTWVATAGGDYYAGETGTKETDAATFTIEFKQQFLDSITTDTDIIVLYTATVNSDAVVNTAMPNVTTLEYGNETRTKEAKAQTFVWGINVQKHEDGDLTKTLKGAQFVIYRIESVAATSTTEASTNIYYAKFDSDNKLTGWSAADTTADTDLVKKEPTYFSGDPFQATILETGDNGHVVVTGVDEGTYMLLEVKAPDGYNKLSAAVTVTINSNSDEDTAETLTQAISAGVNGTQIVTVANNKGAVLPSTGGIGTTIFYVVGSVLVIAAAVLLITKKRMDRD